MCIISIITLIIITTTTTTTTIVIISIIILITIFIIIIIIIIITRTETSLAGSDGADDPRLVHVGAWRATGDKWQLKQAITNNTNNNITET